MEDAARYALVSRLLTSTFTKLHRRTALDTKYSSWKYSGVRTRNPQQVDEIVFPQSKQENVVLEETCLSRSQFVQKVGAYCEQGREGKKTTSKS